MSAMRLDHLLLDIAAPGAGGILVSGLTQDSHAVRAGDAFVALAGARHHGIEFAPAAIEHGAVAILAEGAISQDGLVPGSQTGAPDGQAEDDTKVIWIDDLRGRLGEISSRFFGDPSASMTVVGVTGTNGKTSTVQLLAQAFHHLGRRAASIGTLGAGLHGALEAGERTTPDVIRVHALLAGFRAAGADHVAMEVSSHALAQHRVDGVHFDIAVFTNLTRDHLDYHGSMEAYAAAKARLFDWPALRAVVVNLDDGFGRTLAARVRARAEPPGPPRVLGYGIDAADADLRAVGVQLHPDGLDFELVTASGTCAVRSRLLGRFNVANLLAVAGTLLALEVPLARVGELLAAVQPVDGRMHSVGGGMLPLVVVDYAHTPDALEQALATLRAHCRGKVVCVFGCGGERDAGKRPVMGGIAERLADLAVVTDDNPRGEDGDAIIAQVLAGMQMPDQALVERDRARAIGLALARARPGDVVLVAGKGHEGYQEQAGFRRPFDDLEVVRATLGGHRC